MHPKAERKLKLDSQIVLLSLIILLGFALRLYKMDKMAPFDFDQEYAANFAYSVVKVFPIQLIGQGLSVQGLFMGPLYFYFLVPFYFLFSLHPIGGVIGSIVFGMMTTYLYYWVGKRMFNGTAGLLLSFFRAVLFYKLQVDWSVVPSMSSEFIVLVTWYCFWRLWHKEVRYLPLLGFCFGLYTSMHPILFPFYFAFICLIVVRKFIPNLKLTLLSILTAIIPIAPLILFEYFHKFLEVRRLFSLGNNITGEYPNLDRFIYHIGVIVREPNLIFGLYLKTNWILFAIFIFWVIILVSIRYDFWNDSFHKVMYLLTFFTFVIYYTYLPTHVPEYYFLGVSVLTLFYIGGTLSLLVKKKIFIPVLGVIMIYITVINIKELMEGWNYASPAALYNKEQIVKEIKRVQPASAEFFVSYIREPGWNFGFDYLFKYHGIVPQTRITKKPIYTIVIPKALSPGNLDFVSGNIGLIIEK